MPSSSSDRFDPATEDAPQVARVPIWHGMDVEAVVAALDTDVTGGLTSGEAERRLADHGPNELAREEPRSVVGMLVSQFTSPLIAILVVALIVTLLIDEYTDAAVIAVVLVINAIIGVFQEHKADRSVQALMELTEPQTTAVRDGRTRSVASADLVPGDVVRLSSGTRVPADLRLVGTTALEVDESLLTGESVPVVKTTGTADDAALVGDRHGMAHMGSIVVRGRGTGVVVATAGATQLGSIAESIRTQRRPQTPLQERMDRFARIVAVAVLASTVVAFGLGIALGGAVDEMFLTAVALAVAVVPEGLPVALTVALALGVRRMAQRRAIVRSLPAVETLGSTDVIGSDKTGTLTANRMTVVSVWTPGDRSGLGHDPRAGHDEHPDRHDDRVRVFETAAIANEATAVDRDGELEVNGDPTETALVEAAAQIGIDVMALRRLDTLTVVPFESERRFAMVTVRASNGAAVQHVKGAPERLIELCSRMQVDGESIDLDQATIAHQVTAMARQGLRVLATARALVDEGSVADGKVATEQLELTGLVGLQDPPRQGVVEAIERCRSAGIRVAMITGDHAITARAIADELGIGRPGATVVTGADVEALDDDGLDRLTRETDVYARMSPEHKLRVVNSLRRHGYVVAVTGDGVNDGPALKAADIGVAMGLSGTDVAREASDIVLTDDNFVSIAAAVEEGRVVFDNVRKVTYFLLSTGAASIVAILVAIAAGLPLPYVPAALLWLNVVTNGVQDVALAFEKAEPDVLGRPPRRRDEGVLNGVLWQRVVITGVVMALGSLWLFQWAIDTDLTADQQRGAALTTLVVAMAVHVYSARSERRSIIATHVVGNRLLLTATLVALAVHVGAMWWAPTQRLLQIAPVTAPGWLRILVVAVVVVGASEAHKAWHRSRDT